MFWDDRKTYIQRLKNSKVNIFNNHTNKLTTVENHLTNIQKTAEIYAPLIDQLGTSFQLADLYNLAEQHHLPHPHLTINMFRNKKILIPQGDGMFTWNF
jgi:hypothetical protein